MNVVAARRRYVRFAPLATTLAGGAICRKGPRAGVAAEGIMALFLLGAHPAGYCANAMRRCYQAWRTNLPDQCLRSALRSTFPDGNRGRALTRSKRIGTV